MKKGDEISRRGFLKTAAAFEVPPKSWTGY